MKTVPIKPLFVPLKARWFLAFEDGSKRIEYRLYGPRWNERTCTPGRAVTLSYGYNGRRIKTRVASFNVVAASTVPDALSLYPPDTQLAAIRMDL